MEATTIVKQRHPMQVIDDEINETREWMRECLPTIRTSIDITEHMKRHAPELCEEHPDITPWRGDIPTYVLWTKVRGRWDISFTNDELTKQGTTPISLSSTPTWLRSLLVFPIERQNGERYWNMTVYRDGRKPRYPSALDLLIAKVFAKRDLNIRNMQSGAKLMHEQEESTSVRGARLMSQSMDLSEKIISESLDREE